MRSSEFGVGNAEFGVRGSEFGVRSWEFGVGSAGSLDGPRGEREQNSRDDRHKPTSLTVEIRDPTQEIRDPTQEIRDPTQLFPSSSS